MDTKEADKPLVVVERKTPLGRLAYSGELTPVIERLSATYGIGSPSNFSIINVGYEDCNVIVETPTQQYVAKIFSKARTPENIARYDTIMEKAVEAGVNHPRLLKTKAGTTLYADKEAPGLSLVLMEHVDGDSFFSLDRAPNTEEQKLIFEQAAKVNAIDYHPPYFFDTWAIPNIQSMLERVQQFIEPDDLTLIHKAIEQYTSIPVDTLPHCFVHGDFTKANVLKGNNGKIYILDFSVSNWYPRIQELAVIAANLLHNEHSSGSLRDRTEHAAEEYSKFNPFTPEERQYLYPYALAGVAMEFMGGHQEKFLYGVDTEETEYWLKLGRDGLRKELK